MSLLYLPPLLFGGLALHVQAPVFQSLGLPAEPCSVAPCGQYSFETSPWGSCSALCGSDGTASRNVTCMHNGAEVDATSDEYTQNCLPLGEPFSVRPCFATPCEPYMWRTTAWSNCTSGMQNRTVSCQRVRGGSADASVCPYQQSLPVVPVFANLQQAGRTAPWLLHMVIVLQHMCVCIFCILFAGSHCTALCCCCCPTDIS